MKTVAEVASEIAGPPRIRFTGFPGELKFRVAKLNREQQIKSYTRIIQRYTDDLVAEKDAEIERLKDQLERTSIWLENEIVAKDCSGEEYKQRLKDLQKEVNNLKKNSAFSFNIDNR